MVHGKRGQIFSLMMVFFTLFLCGVVIVLYVVQQGNAEASLVSPSSVLGLRDKVDIFELREVELIKSSLDDGGFGGSFYGNFIDGVMADENMTSFLFDGLFLGGVEVREQDKNRNLLEEGVYSVVDDSSFSRAKIEKRGLMVAKEESKIDFPVYFTFEFEQRYSIDENGEVVKV